MISLKCPECRQALDPETLVCAAGHRVEIREGIIELYSGDFRKKLDPFLNHYHRIYSKENAAWSEAEKIQSPFVNDGPRKKDWALRRKSLRLVEAFLKKEKKLQILEIGPWNGWLSRPLLQAGHRVVAVDYFREAPYGLLALTNSSNSVTCIQTDLRDLSLLADAFDLIILNHCLQFMETPVAVVCSLMNKLNPGGVMIVMGSPFYKKTKNKIKSIRIIQEQYKSKYNFDLFFQAGKGYLDYTDLKSLEEKGMVFTNYPGLKIKNFIAGTLGSGPVYLAGKFVKKQ
ncbi:MAG TPA: class I SAM-dependent methyltransferase [Bacteroidia bacterium]|nr:class I SAM-dependent methyltransferase [Bacteroidia bacterium]